VPAEDLDEYPSVRLFVDRARLVAPHYRLAAHNAAAIASICQRLDGIPLALELAAARVKLLTAEQVAARLDDSLGLLTGGSHIALPRHQTLQATLQWSYDLLAEPERRLLERLSVFAGGSTLAAAEAVCAGEGMAREHLLDTLTALVDKSLVTAERRANQDTRYRLLEMVRQFAAEKLSAAGDRPAVRTRHRDYFLASLEGNSDKLNTADEITWTAQLAADLDNVRLALDWSFRNDSRVDAAPHLVLSMIWLWPSMAESREWSRRAVAYCETHSGIPPQLYAGLLGPAAHLLSDLDVATAVAWSERAVALCQRLGPSQALMVALTDLNWTYFDILGDVERGAAANAEAEAIFQQLGAASFSRAKHITWAAHFVQFSGRLAFKRGQFQSAKVLAAESYQLCRQVGSPNGIDPLTDLGAACLNLGEYDQAQDHFLDALRQTDALPTYWAQNRKNSALRWLGLLELKRGRLDEALAYSHDALKLAAELDDDTIAAGCLGLLAHLAVQAGDPLRAARLSGAAQAMTARQGRQPWIDSSLDTLVPGWRLSGDQAAIETAYRAGQAMPADDAMALALAAD
jgi:tetratricopeptide (TPR) repeat protein